MSLDETSDSERECLPLFGIPISVKENMQISGSFATVGCTKKIDDIAIEDHGILEVSAN